MFRPQLPLETERLALRPFEDGDVEALYAIQRRADVTRYLYWGPRSRADVRRMIERRKRAIGFEGAGDALLLAATLRASGTLIGDVMLRWLSDEHRQGEVGFVLHPEHHGHGYATEMSAAMLEVGFSGLGLHRLIGRCDARNEASAAVMARLGMRREAHFLENEFIQGEWAARSSSAMAGHRSEPPSRRRPQPVPGAGAPRGPGLRLSRRRTATSTTSASSRPCWTASDRQVQKPAR